MEANDIAFLEMVAAGAISGHVSEWPQLRPAVVAVLAENARLRAELEQERAAKNEAVRYGDALMAKMDMQDEDRNRLRGVVKSMLLEKSGQLRDMNTRLAAAEAKLARAVEFLTKWSRWARDEDRTAMTGNDAREFLESIGSSGAFVSHEPAPLLDLTATASPGREG